MKRVVALYGLGLLALFLLYRFGGPNPPSEPLRQLDVTYIGCAEVMTGDRCLMTETATLTFWMPEHECPTAWRGRSRADEARCEDTDDGMRISFRVAPRKQPVTLRLAGAEPWSIPIEPFRWPDVITNAQAARKKRDFAEAIRLASTASTAEDTMVRAAALGILARARHATGDERWRETFEASIATAEEAGWVSGEATERGAATYLLRQSLSFPAARQVVSTAVPSTWGVAKFRLNYHRGLIEAETGVIGRAVRAFNLSLTWGRRLGRPDAVEIAITPLIDALLQLGRVAEARARLNDLRNYVALHSDACREAMGLNNVGWYEIRLGDTDQGSDETLKGLKRAATAYETKCRSEEWLRNVLHTMGELLLVRGDMVGADRTIERLRKLGPTDARQRLQHLLLQARLNVLHHNVSAARVELNEVVARTAVDYLPDLHWLATIELGYLLLAESKWTEAARTFRSAEGILEIQLPGLPLGLGRAGFSGGRKEAVAGLVKALTQLNAPEEASLAIRRWKSRELSTLDSGVRLERLAAGDRHAWDNMVSRYRRLRRSIESRRAELWSSPAAKRSDLERGLAEDTKIARALVQDGIAELGQWSESSIRRKAQDHEAFVTRLEATERTYSFLEYDGHIHQLAGSTEESILSEALARVDADTYLVLLGEWSDDVALGASRLVSNRYIEFGVELPGGAVEGSQTSVLVIADPDGTLPGARREGLRVAALQRRRGFDTDILLGDEATHEAVRTALESGQYGLLHFAGHATFAGRDGSSSSLRLAANGVLEVPDLLSMRTVPTIVVLSGCDTARSIAEFGRGVSLADSFLIAGASFVVATPVPLHDRDAQAFVDHLYSGAVGLRPTSLRKALAAALVEDDSPVAYAAFSR